MLKRGFKTLDLDLALRCSSQRISFLLGVVSHSCIKININPVFKDIFPYFRHLSEAFYFYFHRFQIKQLHFSLDRRNFRRHNTQLRQCVYFAVGST